MTTENSAKLAVLIDADNTSATTVESLLEEIAKYGIASVKRIYGDWSSGLSKWKDALLPHAITPVQQFAYTKGKNATDMAMVIDAMDLLYSNTFDGFCIVSSDSDFTRLASRIRENGLTVYGFGQKKTPESFRKACDKFIYTENLLSHTAVEIGEDKIQTPIFRNKRKTPAELKQDTALINLFRNAVKEHADDEGWTSLGVVGQYINKVNSDFDARNYGYTKLSYLINAIDIFETQMHGNHLWLRLKKRNNNLAPKTENKLYAPVNEQAAFQQQNNDAPLVITIPAVNTAMPTEKVSVTIEPEEKKKDKEPVLVQIETQSSEFTSYDKTRQEQTKRGRGRPRKIVFESAVTPAEKSRGRGRPPKSTFNTRSTKSGRSGNETSSRHYWNRLVPLVQKAIERTCDIEGWATVSSVARELVTGDGGFNARDYGFDSANNAIAAISSEWVDSRKAGRGLRVRVVKPYDVEVDGNTIPAHELAAKSIAPVIDDDDDNFGNNL
ncbi:MULTISPECIES: NYN domain-containing protein [Snodgrassella]|uniref:NYN domain-containing protein n=1 Tax=Snodgrassella TaxID=1193515 RepID=UPI00081595B7|nr:AT hook motif-containing protein [Snodgrassella sp. R-53583]